MSTQKTIKFLSPIFLLFFIIVSASAQNKVVKEIDSFDKVKISDRVNVTFKKADKERITVVAEGIGYDKILTTTSGRSLRIKVKSTFYKDTKVDIEVEYVKIRNLEASNKAKIDFNEKVTGDELTMKVTGGAVVNMDAEISAIKAKLSNGGRIEISGQGDLQEVEANIGSNYNAYEFETEEGFVKSNTNSEITVWVKNRLEASAGSGAEVKYRGKPGEVKSSTSLGGKITGDL